MDAVILNSADEAPRWSTE